MSEKVRLRSLGEKVNLTLFHEIVGFILETASATLEQTRDLANRCLLFNPVQQKPALQEKYGVLYLGELLERYEERFGMPLPDLRAIALSLGFTSSLLTKEMFVASQKKDFLAKVKEQADGDVYLTAALYLLGEATLQEKEYTVTEELIFVLSLSTDFQTAFRHFAPQLLRLLGKGRAMPVFGNISLLEWFITQISLMPKALRPKNMALFRALCALKKSFVRPGSRQHDVLLENGYTPLEIAYMNMALGEIKRHSLTAEKMAVQLFSEVIPCEESFAPEIYDHLGSLYVQERDFSVKYRDTHKLIDALGKDIKIGNALTFVWLMGLERQNHPIFNCFDILDGKWDSLAGTLSERKYEVLFSKSLCSDMSADEIKARIARYDELTGGDYVRKCCENDLCPFGLLIEKGIIDLWELFSSHLEGQDKVIEHIGGYLQGHFTVENFRFYEKFFDKYGAAGLGQFFGRQHKWLFERLVEKKYGYGKTGFRLSLRRPFFSVEEHTRLLDWLQEYYFYYEPDNYPGFVKAVLLNDFAAGLLPKDDQRTLFDSVIQTGELYDHEVYVLKLRYFTPEEQQAEKDAEARGKQERQQREEAERVQRIRENFVRKSDCFENLYYYLEEYRYQKANRRTACETVADHNWYEDKEEEKLWRPLLGHITFIKENPTMTNNPFAGKTVVATGKQVNYTRDGIQMKLLELGAKPGSSVSKKTDYLIVGEKAGSKLIKAQQLGVPTLTEEEFEAMLAE